MLKKHCLFILVLLFTGSTGIAQTATDKKEAAFAAAAKAVVDNFYRKNVKQLNSYIDPKTGVYIIYRPGAIDAFKNETKLDINEQQVFANTEINRPDYFRTPFQYGKLPAYDCDKGEWNKKGFAADSAKNYKPVSTIAAFRVKYNEQKISKKEFIKIRAVEAASRKIVYAGSKANGIVFYLCWSGTRWYLSVIDVITTDCSA